LLVYWFMVAANTDRIHSLDNLRAVLMFLGIVLHSAVPYMESEVPPQFWPFQEAQRSQAFDLVFFYIHSFRMPLFFVLAGFFARMIFLREGAAGFLRHRMLRLGIPLALFLPAVYLCARHFTLQQHPELAEYRLVTLHLWFLYYLFGYSLLAGLLGHASQRWDAGFARLWQSRWRWPALVNLTAAFLATQYGAGFDPDMELAPNPYIVLCYALLYGIGWFLYPLRETLATWQPFAAWQTAAASLLVLAYLPLALTLYAAYGKLPDPPQPAHAVATVLAAALTWLFIFGITGLFLRFAATPSPLLRYLAGSAYWAYLAHAFPVVAIPIWLKPLPWPLAAKFGITVAGATLFCVITYELAVRRTPWGWLFGAPRNSTQVC
jgi:glucan biosynthesis protein C